MFGLFNSFSYADTVLNVYTWNLSKYAVNILNWNYNLWVYFDNDFHYDLGYFDKNWLSSVNDTHYNELYSNTQFVISYMYWWRNIKRYISYFLWKDKDSSEVYYTNAVSYVFWNWYFKKFSSPDLSNGGEYDRDYSTNTYIAYTWYKLYFYSTVKNSDDIFGFYFDLTTWFNLHYFHWEKPDFNWITLNNNSIVYPVWNKLLIRKYNWIVLNSSWFVNSFDLKSVSLPVSSDRFTTWNSFVFSDYPYSYVYTNWNMTYLKWFVYKNWDKIKSTTYNKSLYSWFSFSNGLFYGSKLLSGWIVEVDEISKSNTVALNSVLPVSNWSNNWSNWEEISPYTSNVANLGLNYNSEWNIPYLFKWKYYNNKNQLFLPYYTNTWSVVDLAFNLQSYFTWYNWNWTWLDAYSYNISWFNSYNNAYYGWQCEYDNWNDTKCILYDFWNNKNYTYFYDITWAIFFYQEQSDFSKWDKKLCFVKNNSVGCMLPTNLANPIVQSNILNWQTSSFWNNLSSSWTLANLETFNSSVCPVSWHFLKYINPTIWWFTILGWTAPSYHPFENFACLFNIIGWAYSWNISWFSFDLSAWHNVISSWDWQGLNDNVSILSFWDILIILIIFSLWFGLLFNISKWSWIKKD